MKPFSHARCRLLTFHSIQKLCCILMLTVGWVHTGFAASTAFCASYATEAVKQQSQNVANAFDGGSLELVGDAWSFDKNNHFQWCRGVSEDSANQQRIFRDGELKRGIDCKFYAATAKVAQLTNLENRCGFSGDAWSTDYRNHYLWCMSQQRPGVIGRETSLRQSALDRCGPRPDAAPGEAATCREYADNAIQAQSSNEESQCGFSGDAWSYNHQGHEQWCLGVSVTLRNRESANRSNALQACGACKTYARTALDQFVKNIQNNCGFSGDAWSANLGGHLNWCLAQGGNGAPQRENDARSAKLGQCGVRNSVTTQWHSGDRHSFEH